jgi:hypothetical protein
MIATDAQHLGSELLQSAMILPKCSRLGGSARGEIEYMEGEYHMLLTPELGETEGLIIGRRQGKVGGNLSDVSRHRLSFLAVPMRDAKSIVGVGRMARLWAAAVLAHT